MCELGVRVLVVYLLELPVITSNAYGFVDACVAGETGLRCGVNDPEGLYKCMKNYYEDAELRKQHGTAGRKRVVEHFSNDVVSKAWLEIYREMLG